MIFKDFLEYWKYVRCLSEKQQGIIFKSLSIKERNFLLRSCSEGKWDDVMNRNLIDNIVDDIQKKYNHNLIDIRHRVLKNQSVYVSTDFWEMVLNKLKQFDNIHKEYVVGGIKAIKCSENKKVTLLLPYYSQAKN